MGNGPLCAVPCTWRSRIAPLRRHAAQREETTQSTSSIHTSSGNPIGTLTETGDGKDCFRSPSHMISTRLYLIARMRAPAHTCAL